MAARNTTIKKKAAPKKQAVPKKKAAPKKQTRNQNKTTHSAASVAQFIAGIGDDDQRKDTKAVVALMKKVTGERPTMWGSSIIGFGKYHYRYPSGREGDFFLTGVSPRKGNLTLYIVPGFTQHGALLAGLGKHKTAKSCLYVKRLADIDSNKLEQLIARSVEEMRRRYPADA